MPQDYYIADVRQNAVSVFDSGFEIDNRTPAPLEIVVARGGGVVEGIVAEGPLKTVAGAVVALVPESSRFDNRALFATAASDAYGHFVLRGVAPGIYRLFAWESTPPNAYQNAAFISRYEARAKVVQVSPGSTVQSELTLIR
jgi:hypothetical protein